MNHGSTRYDFKAQASTLSNSFLPNGSLVTTIICKVKIMTNSFCKRTNILLHDYCKHYQFFCTGKEKKNDIKYVTDSIYLKYTEVLLIHLLLTLGL